MIKLEVIDGYDKKTKGTYRIPASVAEMRDWCDSHSHITFVDLKGFSRTAKVNGKVRTWKRDLNRIEVPIKYGMYEYGTFTQHDIQRVLIPV